VNALTWKPFARDGLRLYRVTIRDQDRPRLNRDLVVAATSARLAARQIADLYRDARLFERASIKGHALLVYAPGDWGEE
jgi:hypothetical protein